MTPRSYLNSFELMVLLAIIRLGDTAYGVTISHELEETTGRETVLGSVYNALDRLEAKGLITSRLGDPTPARGGWAKRYFHVNAKGLSQVETTRQALTALWTPVPAGGRP
jgi:PadR family transcriptional regulator, regulatory protein PadR